MCKVLNFKIGDKEKALTNYKKALELDPNNGNTADIIKKLQNGQQKLPSTKVFAKEGLRVVNSTFVILSGICANVGQMFSQCPTIVNT